MPVPLVNKLFNIFSEKPTPEGLKDARLPDIDFLEPVLRLFC